MRPKQGTFAEGGFMTLALTALTEEDVWRELAERFAGLRDREALCVHVLEFRVRQL